MATFLNQTVTPNVNIPTDVYAYSGLPKQYRESVLGTVIPQLNAAVPQMKENVTGIYNSMPETIMPYMNRAMTGFKDATQQPFQGLLNNLSSRNMMNSKVAADAMSSLGTGLNQQMFGDLSKMALETQLKSKEGLANFEQQYPSILANIAGLGQVSEQPFQPYQAFLNLLQNMM